jgi:hypothetical protein
LGNNGILIVMRRMCEYSMQIYWNGLEQQNVCNLSVIVGTIYIICK